MSNTNCIVDEFGRDLSLKKSLFDDLLSRFKGMSWAEINWLVEDEEEQANKTELQKLHDERKRLYAQGLYELEEGEVLDYP